jgi:sulfur-carrier protein
MAQCTLLYFAWIREAVGVDSEVFDVPATISTPAELAAHLGQRNAGFARAFADMSRVRCAIDQAVHALDTPFGAPQEIAFFPPVTGG